MRQYVGQEGREFGRVDEGRRVGGQLTPFDAPRKETAQGRNAPRERAGRVAAFAQPSDEQRDVFVVEAAEGRFQLVEEVPERIQILFVGGYGVAREPPFGYESIKPAGSQFGGKNCRGIGAPPALAGNGRCMDSRGRLHVRRIHQSMGNRKPIAVFGSDMMNERHVAYVCMGSNMGEPEMNLARAREVLGSLPGWKIEAASPVYFTEPQEMRDQPWFANQVLKVSCALDMTAPEFLDMLLDVEKRLGRVRETSDPAMRFGPRVIDLDLLLFDQDRWDTPHLALPHPRMSERAFVLVPLRDIEPNLLLSDGRTPGEALRSLAHAVEGNRIRQ